MCFSATASFTASGILSLAGILAVTKTIERKKFTFLPIALIPLFFGIQQLFEGLVWLYWIPVCVWIYLFFAYAFWPIWVPLSMYIYEKRKKKLMLAFLILGVIVGAVSYGYLLWHHHLVVPRVVSHSICYTVPCAPPTSELIFYAIATILPPLFATSNKIKILGVLILISAIVSYFFYFFAFASVWCFFAAIISLWIIFIAWRI